MLLLAMIQLVGGIGSPSDFIIYLEKHYNNYIRLFIFYSLIFLNLKRKTIHLTKSTIAIHYK